MLRLLDLFSGIGGFSLGLERTGAFRTVAFCEIEEFPRRVLNRHWPDVPCFSDVRMLTGEGLELAGIEVDAICGGFPCQDISLAGKGAGLAGERSGLWFEMHRILRECAEVARKEKRDPPILVAENVAALRARGLAEVLGSLAAIGYDAEWHCIPASAVGAPHRRDRIWIVAYPQREQLREQPGRSCGQDGPGAPEPAEYGVAQYVADPESQRCEEARGLRRDESPRWTAGGGEALADPNYDAPQRWTHGRVGRLRIAKEIENHGAGTRAQWGTEPDVGRVVDGVSTFMDCVGGIPIEAAPIPNPNKSKAARAHRLKALGNAVVPQIPELIGYAILDALRSGY